MDAEPENETFSQKMWEVAFEGGREKNIKRNQKKNRIINRKMEKFDAYSQHSFPVQISFFLPCANYASLSLLSIWKIAICEKQSRRVFLYDQLDNNFNDIV